jgi:hypothetical protein
MLPADQRKRLYDRRYRAALEADPITMEIDGEKLRFYYTDRLRDLPNTQAALHKIINLLKTPDDWAILPRLLEGLVVQSKRKLKYPNICMLIRRASIAGCLHTIMTCAREVKRTGFRLDQHEKACDLMVNIQIEAILSDFDEGETSKALQRTERVLDMLEEEGHQPTIRKDREIPDRSYPLHKDPILLAGRLHMAAAMAVKHQNGQDTDGKVAKYARELVALWPEGRGVLELYTEDDAKADKSLKHLDHPVQIIYTSALALHGFQLAAQVVDSELADQLRARCLGLERDLGEALAERPLADGRRLHQVYRKLFGEPPSVAADEQASDEQPVAA